MDDTMKYIVENYQSLKNFREIAIRSLKDKFKRDGTRKLAIESVRKDRNCPYPDLIKYAFGSIDNAIREAGLYPAHPNDEDLKRDLREFYEEHKRPPRLVDAEEGLTTYSCNAYKHHFGSWNNALKAAGFPVIEPRGGRKKATRDGLDFKTTIIST